MSTVFSKNKEKRSRSSSNEANNSFVKNVTSRVSGLLPATITKWFSSPSSSNANGSTAAADATDSSTEDEAPESPIRTEPPLKRMRFSSPGKYNHFGPTDISCVSSNMDTLEQCAPYTSSVQSPPGRTTFRRETNFVSTPIRSPNAETTIDKSDRESTVIKSQHSLSSAGPSIATKRKSIFEHTNEEDSLRACARTASNVYVNPKSPGFKPGLFCSPFYTGRTIYGGASMYINQPNIKHRKVGLVNKSSSNDNTTMSQSARRVMDLLENLSSPLSDAKRISQYLRSPNNDSISISGAPYSPKMSYKTQELHVPSIAKILRLKQRSRIMDTTNAARQIIASHSSTSDYRPYPTASKQNDENEKDTSSKFTTKVKSRLTRPQRGESDVDGQMVAPINLPTGVLQIDKNNMPKFSFGIPSSNPASCNAPVKSLFTPIPVITQVPESMNKIKETVLSEPALSKPELTIPATVTSNDSYKFSSPVRLTDETSLVSSTPPMFKFGSPDRGVDKPAVVEKRDDDSSCVVGTTKDTEIISVTNPKDQQCPDGWMLNNCETNQATNGITKSSKCSICKLADSQSHCDKCVNCEKVQLNNNTKFPSVQSEADASKWKCEDCWVSNKDVETCVCCGGRKPKSSAVTSSPAVKPITTDEWKCDDCWIKNKSSADNCVACGGSKPGEKSTVIVAVPDNEWKCDDCWVKNKSSADKCVACGGSKPGIKQTGTVAASDKEWKCDDCWVKNKSSADKCVACGGSKPGAKSTAASTLPTNNFGSTFWKKDNNLNSTPKSQKDWECQSCLVRNEYNRSTCICCEAGKPGSIPESALKFKFGITPNTSFKFGIDVKTDESKSSRSADDMPAEVPNKPEESETNNNTLPKTPSFSFGITLKKIGDLTGTPKVTNTNEASKMNFNFGIPKTQASSEPIPTPVFGFTNKLSEPAAKTTDEDEKLQEVPKVQFTLPPPKATSNPLNVMFGSQTNVLANMDKPLPPLAALPSLIAISPKKAPKSSPVAVQSNVTRPQATQPQASFTFTKSPVNIFAAPAATTSAFVAPTPASPVAAVPMFQSPKTNNTPNMSMFQKPETATTSTVSLFHKTDTNTTTTPPSLAATAPIFSFGNNAAPSVAPQPEKPKFNFTFGSTSPMFNNSFAAPATESNTNKFAISGTGLVSGGKGLAGSGTLVGGNGLTGNKIGSSNNDVPISTNNDIQVSGGLFGAPTQKENLWSTPSSNPNNMFVSNASSNPLQKPGTFTFGTSTPFNANNATPTFGSNAPATQSMFGLNQSAGAAPMFLTPVQSQPAPSLFGAGPPAASPAPALGMFGSPGGAPAFAPNSAIPTFEAPPLATAPAPAFNFGASQASGVFGFGQQQQQQQQQQHQQQHQQQQHHQQPQQAGVYSFGAPSAGQQVQFNMGSAPNTTMRRVRKAVRRHPQR